MLLPVFSSKLNDAESKSSSIEQKQQAQALKTTLENVGRFTIAKQVGEGGHFGTVTDREVTSFRKRSLRK